MTAPSQPSPSQRLSEAGPTPWVARLSAAGTLATVGLMPADARAAVVKVTGSPISLSLNDTNIESLWDIDGQGAADFRLQRNGDIGKGYMYFQSVSLQGLGVVGYRAGFQNAPVLARQYSNDVIGTSRIFVPANEPIFGSFGISVLGTFSRTFADLGGQLSNGFSASADNYFGFRFDLNGNTHYGYGIMQFDLDTRTVSISSWAYESDPDKPITVSSLEPDPAPVPGPIGLAGLAAGAAWTRKLRRRIRQTESAEEA